nr:MAG TPA: collagen alpha 1(VIII) chain protein [Caudoviricetes sp.]
MNAEMYAKIGDKALPKDNLNVVKVVNFVDEEGQPVTMGQGPAGPAGPIGPAGPAASITKAAHVDGTTGTIGDIVTALVNAGLMAEA